MRIVVVDAYYPLFLSDVYARRPLLAGMSYAEQLETLLREGFSTSDFYARNLRLLGYDAEHLIANCEPLQRAWAAENGLRTDEENGWEGRFAAAVRARDLGVGAEPWSSPVLLAQVRSLQPDVVFVQDPDRLSIEDFRELRRHCSRIVTWLASPAVPLVRLEEYDLVLTATRHLVDTFRRQGARAEFLRMGFEESILSRVGSRRHRYPVAFVGGLSPAHRTRIELLEHLAGAGRDVALWGWGAEHLDEDSALRARHRGHAWGIDMYQVLRDAAITLNCHIDMASESVGNMRMYEATGVGSLLLTDYKPDLENYFEVGVEVLAFRNAGDCEAQLRHLMRRPEEIERIAKAGQARTLRDHTWRRRVEEFAGHLAALF